MSAALLVARLVLAAVFAVAGAAKLATSRAAAGRSRHSGVPAGLAGVVGVALPLAELAVAVLLLPEATAWWGALGALVLLLLFCAAIGVSLARGRAPDCHCFGQLHSAPAGRSTLVRNGALAAVALFVLVAGFDDAGPGALEWIGDLEGSELIALVAGAVGVLAVVACAALALRLLRAHGRMLLRLDELEERLRMAGIDLPDPDAYQLEESPLAGEPAPPFALPALDGSTVSLEDLLEAGRRCWCSRTPAAGRARSPPRRSPSGSGRSPRAGLVDVVVERRRPGGRAREARRRPAGAVAGARQRRRRARVDLTRQRHCPARGARRRRRRRRGRPGRRAPRRRAPARTRPGCGPRRGRPDAGRPRPGSEAPALVLAALEGGEVAVAAPRTSAPWRAVLDPDCGFCRQLHPALRAGRRSGRGRARPAGGLVLVGRLADRGGLPLDGAARSAGARDGGFRRGRHPVAVRLDAQGLVASRLAAGGDAVLALLGDGGAPALEVHRRGPAPASA